MIDPVREKIFQNILSEYHANSKTTRANREDFTTWLYAYVYNLPLKDERMKNEFFNF